MYLCDLHTHSIASGHASQSTIADMAKTAYDRGLTLLGITDHGPATLGSATPSYYRSLANAPRKRCGIDLAYGVELNILDYEGRVDLPDEILDKLDYAIISMHRPTIRPGSPSENTAAYIKAMKHPKVRMIGHCDDVHFPVDYVQLVKAAKEHNVLIEINNSSLSPEGYRGNTIENNIRILTCCAYLKHPILLSSDSHGCKDIGNFTYADDLIRSIGFPQELILNSNPEQILL